MLSTITRNFRDLPFDPVTLDASMDFRGGKQEA